MRSKIDPMKQMAKTARKRRELLLNWFRADGRLSSGVVEGFNNKLKLITRRSYGFRTQEAYETALHHNLGTLPKPDFPHRLFCGGNQIIQMPLAENDELRQALDQERNAVPVTHGA